MQTFAYQDNYLSLCMEKINQYFDKSTLIASYTNYLKRSRRKLHIGIIGDLVRKTVRVLLKIVLTNFDTIFKLITYIAVVTVASRDYGMHTFELFNIAIIMWSFFSFVIPASNTTLLNKLSVYIVFPTFILGLIFTKFYSSLIQTKILSKFIKSSDSTGDMSSYFQH